MSLSVCIATYKRPERLALLLTDLRQQVVLPAQVVVVDNDAGASALAVVQCFRVSHPPFSVEYACEQERGIAKARNRCVALARGDWIAFIDDDERAPPEWLGRLVEAVANHGADGVLGPVEPAVPSSAPAWIRRGRFYDFHRMPTGSRVPLNRMRFGNVLLKAAWLREEPGPFDTRYGLATGEDGDLLVRLAKKGARIIWCDSAPVIEPVETRRLSLSWLLRRAMSGGQEFAHQTLRGAYRPMGFAGKAAFFVRASVQLTVSAAMALLSFPAGRHRAVAWLMKAAANVGKLTAFWGWRYRAYA